MVDGIIEIPLPGQPLKSPRGADGDRNSHCVLCHFLAGPENRLVETVVRCVLGDHLGAYNPLVIYGPSGTGKTHLVRGMSREWVELGPHRRAVYTTAVDFSRELADAVETQAMDEFRTRHCEVSMLVFEDVGELAGREAAQRELIHTLDVLLAAGEQVIATAPAAPSELPRLMTGLQSRLAAGLTVPLFPPGPDTRSAILRRLAELRGIKLSAPVAQLLAEALAVTVPDLFAALIHLGTCLPLNQGTIDADSARRYLATRNRSRHPQLHEIALGTARLFSLKLSDLRGPSRRRAVVTARGLAMYLARHLTDRSLDQIGHYFGGRDHTTVMHSCRRTESQLRTDPVLRQAAEQFQGKW